MSRITFSGREIKKAHNSDKTLFSFQYIEGKDGKYICEGSLVQVAEFMSGAIAKILLMSDMREEDVGDFCNDMSKRIKEIYQEHK